MQGPWQTSTSRTAPDSQDTCRLVGRKHVICSHQADAVELVSITAALKVTYPSLCVSSWESSERDFSIPNQYTSHFCHTSTHAATTRSTRHEVPQP